MKYIKNKYSFYRSMILSKKAFQKFFKFASLPELKFLKTCGFIATILF